MEKNKSKLRKKKGTPTQIDSHVGQRIRLRRSLLGLSQEKLADAVGLTFQQVQKYERGTNRVSAGRLFELSNILDVPVSYFFDQISETLTPVHKGLADNSQETFSRNDLMTSKETLDLLRAYYSVEDTEARKDMLKVIKSMAERLSPSKS